ncbi:YhcN/YlaJ family sporulation lipoprotein [Anaerosolibacter carboniphilus]|uniref:YhcN/YlaJ family sporulation lipoprotein n=1 Tax=Anaerosolibacter carboniphilus TaxID=1417629 RepID=A0A841KYI2_9FIRM|nr:YhcN/YlaJ family sporulation lipoprotein [Anaerosolibacter carboniphilus]MBB6217020.1 YhcN/YlaJ family sporulation lipoprotein [Anaerosolibacter carboniphilus]
MKKTIALMLALLMIGVLVMGCQPARRPVPYTNEEGMARRRVDVNDLNIRAERITSEIDKFSEINKSYVVVTDGTALVGVTTNEKNKRTVSRGLREDIERKIQSTDNQIDRVYVTADAGLVERIRRVSQNISKGYSLTGMADEIQDLLNDMKESM